MPRDGMDGAERAEGTAGEGFSFVEPPPEPEETEMQRKSRDPKQADLLIALASEAELFHTRDGVAYADVTINGHRETWPVASKGFRRWLRRRYFERHRGAPNGEAMQAALGIIDAKAHYDAPERSVHVRVAGLDGKIYLDLADDAWRTVEIGSDGWRIVTAPPVRFRRAAGMLALPEPVRGGSIKTLRQFLNVGSDADFVLLVAWVLAALRDCGPYPVLIAAGENGAAKSTLIRLLRLLTDPNASALRTLPREDRDLFIAATNAHVLAFDNVSGLPAWISDTLCRLATGGGFAVRQLYTDGEETLFDAMRPIALNGIEDVVTRPDLADRGLFLTLEAIPEEVRRAEKDMLAEFEAARPAILGALLGAIAHGLRALPRTQLARLPRMADFAIWASACEGALWPAGSFIGAYEANRARAVAETVEADTVGAVLLALLGPGDGAAEWSGTAEALLLTLREQAGEAITRNKTWPASPRALAGRLRRLASFLRRLGVEVEFEREGKARTRTIRIGRARPAEGGKRPSAPSASSAQQNRKGKTDTLVAAEADGMAEADDICVR